MNEIINRLERLEQQVFGEVYNPNKEVQEYKKIRYKDLTDVHIYKTSTIPEIVLGQRYKREKIEDIVKQYEGTVCAVNAGFWPWDDSTIEHYGILITDNGERNDIKYYYQSASTNFASLIVWKDGRVELTNKTYSTNELVDMQKNAHFAAGTSYALVIDGKESLLNRDLFSHSKTRNARTMIGYDEVNKLWYLVVADGGTTWDKGLLATEQADIMLDLGCTVAANLDGGGSSAMVFNNKVVTGNYTAPRLIGTAFIVRPE